MGMGVMIGLIIEGVLCLFSQPAYAVVWSDSREVIELDDRSVEALFLQKKADKLIKQDQSNR